ncbi:MAG: sulfotransferase domain-containing protein [Pseudomonadota bacterium]
MDILTKTKTKPPSFVPGERFYPLFNTYEEDDKCVLALKAKLDNECSGDDSHISYLKHLPETEFESRYLHLMAKLIRHRIRKKFYKDRLVIMTSMPKSASKATAKTIAALQNYHGYVESQFGQSIETQFSFGTVETSFNADILLRLPDGGVWHKHLQPDAKLLQIVSELKCKLAVVVRHPLDHLAAIYAQTSVLNIENTFVGNPIFLLESKNFLETQNKDEVIKYLIMEGYLWSVLEWIAAWERIRGENSFLSRYEDVIADQEAHFSRLNTFFFNKPMDENVLELCLKQFHYRKKEDPLKDKNRRYDAGWTGKTSIYKDYMTSNNISLYEKVTKTFLEAHPLAKYLLRVYSKSELLLLEEYDK